MGIISVQFLVILISFKYQFKIKLVFAFEYIFGNADVIRPDQ